MPNFAAVYRAISEEIGDTRVGTELFYSIRFTDSSVYTHND